MNSESPQSAFDAKLDELERGNVNERAAAIGLRYGQIEGDHHRVWVIDQMLRVLAGAAYAELRELYEEGGEYEWDEGIAP